MNLLPFSRLRDRGQQPRLLVSMEFQGHISNHILLQYSVKQGYFREVVPFDVGLVRSLPCPVANVNFNRAFCS